MRCFYYINKVIHYCMGNRSSKKRVIRYDDVHTVLKGDETAPSPVQAPISWTHTGKRRTSTVVPVANEEDLSSLIPSASELR